MGESKHELACRVKNTSCSTIGELFAPCWSSCRPCSWHYTHRYGAVHRFGEEGTGSYVSWWCRSFQPESESRSSWHERQPHPGTIYVWWKDSWMCLWRRFNVYHVDGAEERRTGTMHVRKLFPTNIGIFDRTSWRTLIPNFNNNLYKMIKST